MAACSVAASVVVSCSTEVAISTETPDSGHEASASDAGSTPGEEDAAPPPHDAGRSFDGGPLPVVCASAPCAQALVTFSTSGFFEGFCALLQDRTVACWGENASGWLGRGADAATYSPTAARVVGVSNVIQLEHTCALDDSGEVWCWGRGPHLVNDAGTLTSDLTPVRLSLPPATLIGIGTSVGCALSDGHLLCWGANSEGQIAPLDSAPSGSLGVREVELPSGAPIRQIVIGAATFLVREDGSVLSWGANPPLARVSSLNPDSFPKPIELEGVSSLDVVQSNTCATAAGTGYCWGQSLSSAPLDRALPEPVVTPEPIVRIATSGPLRWCAVGASGDVYCWGTNASGQAGDGTKEHANEPVRVKLPGPAADVKTTPEATCALLTSGKVYCWGSNFYGQLGNGKPKVPSVVPEEVVLP